MTCIDDLEPGQIWRGAGGPMREIVAIDGEAVYYRKVGMEFIFPPVSLKSFAKWALLDLTEKKQGPRRVA